MAQIRFQSKEYRPGAFCRSKDHVFYSIRSERKRNNEVDALSMLTKLGICVAACALVFVLNAQENEEYSKSNSELNTEENEKPGSLQFVEIPGLLSVFSPEDAYAVPLLEFEAEFQEKNKLLCLLSTQTQSVSAVEGGIVDQISQLADGWSLTVISQKGRIWSYTGLKNVRPEIGQSLSVQDTVGEMDEGAMLYIRCEKDGKAVDLKKAFELDKKL